MRIEEAEERLRRATEVRPLRCWCPSEASHRQDCPWMAWCFRRDAAEAALHRQATDTLKVLLLAVEALEVARCQGCGETHTCRRCKALDAWKKL